MKNNIKMLFISMNLFQCFLNASIEKKQEIGIHENTTEPEHEPRIEIAMEFTLTNLAGNKVELDYNSFREEELEKIKNLQDEEKLCINIDGDLFDIVGTKDPLNRLFITTAYNNENNEEGDLLNYLFGAYFFSKVFFFSKEFEKDQGASFEKILSVEELNRILAFTKFNDPMNIINIIEAYNMTTWTNPLRITADMKFMVSSQFMDACIDNLDEVEERIIGDWLEAIISTSLNGINKDINREDGLVIYLLQDQLERIKNKDLINYILNQIKQRDDSITEINRFRNCLSKAFKNFCSKNGHSEIA